MSLKWAIPNYAERSRGQVIIFDRDSTSGTIVMKIMFRNFFFLGLVGCVLWLLYAALFPTTLLWESVGVACISLTIIGLTVWQTLSLLGKLRAKSETEVSQIQWAERLSVLQLGKLRKWHVVALLGALVVVFASLLVRSALTENAEIAEIATREIQAGRTNCTSFIDREFNRRSFSEKAKALGSWQKREHIVVEVGWKESAVSSAYVTRLCVYDPSTGNLVSPGALGRFRWEK